MDAQSHSIERCYTREGQNGERNGLAPVSQCSRQDEDCGLLASTSVQNHFTVLFLSEGFPSPESKSNLYSTLDVQTQVKA